MTMTTTTNGTACTCTSNRDHCAYCRAVEAAAGPKRKYVRKAPPPESSILPAGRELLTVREVGRVLGMSVRTVFRYAALGLLPPAVKFTCKLIRWRRADVMKFVEGLDGGAPPPAA